MQGVRSISSPIGQEYYAYGYLSTDSKYEYAWVVVAVVGVWKSE